eukprot:TRINITY_DN11656_c0_g1_i3.p1 TRINITY_DN11656_c0_g1~~TRINITY_DN11656_c0_g1_i3.p1  ORF type:complete len:500 (+),score=106.42 TRINITY_DN11656_c0_g1_i3:230-1729(+)
MVLDVNTMAIELESERAPVTVVCSVDRSGSMAGSKFKAVQSTLTFLVGQLSAKDKFGLVAWDDKVEVKCTPSFMDQAGKQIALDAIGQMKTRGSTNLSGGLLQAINELAADEHLSEAGRSSSVLLFTDGHANHGITDRIKIGECTRGGLEACSSTTKPCVFTFGYGLDHDADMLRTISDEGNGLYYFLENEETIPQTLADCLGGLMSVVGQNLVLTVEALNGCTIADLHSKVNVVKQEPTLLKIELGDIYSEESRDSLMSLDLPASEEQDEMPICTVSLEYFDTVACCPGKCDATVNLRRVATMSESDQLEDSHVAGQYGRVAAALAMERANELGRAGKLEDARALLRETRESLPVLDEMSLEFQKDLLACEEGMTDTQAYRSMGSKTALNYACKAHSQRSCSHRSGRTVQYQTKSKKAMSDGAYQATFTSPPANKTETQRNTEANAQVRKQRKLVPAGRGQPIQGVWSNKTAKKKSSKSKVVRLAAAEPELELDAPPA